MRTIILLSIVIFVSCSKKYKYIEQVRNYKSDGTKEIKYRAAKIIEADTDSAAYCLAYQNFCISNRSTDELARLYGKPFIEPVNYILLNNQNEDIKDKVFFFDKLKREKEIREMVLSIELPK